MRQVVAVVVALAFLGLAVPSALAQVPAGGEFRVNTATAGLQALPKMASGPDGSFVVVWEDWHDLFSSRVSAQRYDASGMPLGSEFLVSTPYISEDTVDVATDATGNFVVVWESLHEDGDNAGVFAQRFDASGNKRGAEFQVNTHTTGYQGGPSVASDASGNFVVAWSSGGQGGTWYGTFAQRYDASGQRRGSEFRVNTTPERAWLASVASDPAGNFVIAWEGWVGGPSIFARRYDASGVPHGPEFRVNAQTTGLQLAPSVSSDAAGRFVVAWSRKYLGPPQVDEIFARRYDAAGAPVGDDFRVNSYTGNSKGSPQVVSNLAGDFVVVWQSGGQDGSGAGVFAQRYDASGAPRGIEFQVNTATSGWQHWHGLGSDAVGNLFVAWASQEGGPWVFDLLAQRFGGLLPAALAVDTAATNGSDGNRVLEPGESVDVRPSWRNVNGAAQTFDGNAVSFSGPLANGVSYQLPDGAGAYGTVANGATAPCSDCYQAAVAFGGTRPSFHWDATLTERITPDALGQTKPWSMHVGESFMDVPRPSPYYRFVETLLHKGVTAGCGAGAYCPSAPTTREQMAAFVLLAREGAGYAPTACSTPNLFTDVPETSIFCDVIEDLARRGVVSGCGGGNYCPTSAVSREQMAVFVLRTLDPALSPPPCTTPVFADVPASSPYCPWIEELARRGIVAGCGGGNYCPLASVTREQMAVFLTGTFGLTLYGP